MTIFWRNKERWSKKKREEDNIWREKKKGKKCGWVGGRRGGNIPLATLKTKKENKQKNMSDMKTLVSVATDNGCLWPSEPYPVRLGPGTSESYRSQALYRGLCAVGKQLERELALGHKGLFLLLLVGFCPSYLSFGSQDEVGMAA